MRLADRPDTAFGILDRMRYWHVPGVSLAVVDDFATSFAAAASLVLGLAWAYLGSVEKLRGHVTAILAGKEVVVTAARYDRHRRIARWTLPIWLYVSVTGVVVYVMLYHR